MVEIWELIIKAQNGDKDAKQKIVEENAGLVWSIVKKFLGRGYDAEDLFQIGSIGLLKCIEKFDLSYDVKFSTYAVPMIMGEIKRFLRDDGMIKVSRTLKEISTRAKVTAEIMTHKNNTAPTMDELARELNIDVQELYLAMDAGVEVESLYSTVYQNDNSQVFLIDKLTHDESEEGRIVNSLALKQAISKLSPKERQVIMMRYFDDKTQTEVGNIIGISQVQVSRIEKKVLKSMRDKLGG